MEGAHGPTRLGLELYTRDLLTEAFGDYDHITESMIRRTSQRVADMVIREYSKPIALAGDVIPIPVCPDCHTTMSKQTEEDVDGVMLVHWCCACEWDGEYPTGPPVDVVALFCSECGETISPRPEALGVVACPRCGHPMSLQLVKGEDRAGWGITTQPPHDVVKTGEDGEVTSG